VRLVRRRIALRVGFGICLLVVVGLSLAACGGSDADTYGESDPQVVSGSSFIVEMQGNQFSPKGISVEIGTTVTWVNDDQVAHNVRQVESEFLSPDSISPGESFSYTFSRPGTFRYQCTFHHPTMNGVVIVQETDRP
jgi:plastocyanin